MTPEDLTLREGEEKYVVDSRKAELMAYAEDPYRVFEKNARAAGLGEVALDIANLATAKGDEAAEKYEKEQAWIKDELFRALEIVKDRKANMKEEIVLGMYDGGEATDELLERLYATLGVQAEANTIKRQYVIVQIKSREALDEAFKKDKFALFYSGQKRKGMLRTLPTPFGFIIRELAVVSSDDRYTEKDDSRLESVVLTMQADHSDEITRDADQYLQANLVELSKIHEKEAGGTTLEEWEKAELERHGRLSLEELQVTWFDYAKDKVLERRDLYRAFNPISNASL